MGWCRLPGMLNWLYTSQGQLDWKWVVTTAIACVAAFAVAYREWAARRERRTAIKVELSLSIVAMFPTGPRWQFQVWVVNNGGRDVTFNANSIAIQTTGWESRFVVFNPTTDAVFPNTLEPGTSFYVMTDRAPLVAALKAAPVGIRPSIRAIITDALGREHRSAWQFAELNNLPDQYPG